MEEETPPIPNAEHPSPEKWYTPLTRVTPLSKAFAVGLFILLPFVGFVVGVGYGKTGANQSVGNELSSPDGKQNGVAPSTQKDDLANSIISLEDIDTSSTESVAVSGDTSVLKGTDYVYVCNRHRRVCKERPEIDPGSIAFLDKKVPYGESYLIDAHNVFFFGSGSLTLIEGADPKTFQALGKGYARDQHAIYYEWNGIGGADPDTFTVTMEGYSYISAQDAKRKYYGRWSVVSSERVTFGEGESLMVDNVSLQHYHGSPYYRNDTQVYEKIYEDHTFFLVERSEFEPSSFAVLGLCWESGNAVRSYYLKDNFGVYCADQRMDADPATFSVLDYSFGNMKGVGIASLAKDKNHLFLAGRIVEHADPSSFEVLNDTYAKDKSHVFEYSDFATELIVVEGETLEIFVVPSGGDVVGS